MKTILIFTIKIGDYYLKRNLKAYSDDSSDEVNIHRTAAADFGYMDLVQDGDVEWTTSPSTYRIVTPFVGMSEGEYNGRNLPSSYKGTTTRSRGSAVITWNSETTRRSSGSPRD